MLKNSSRHAGGDGLQTQDTILDSDSEAEPLDRQSATDAVRIKAEPQDDLPITQPFPHNPLLGAPRSLPAHGRLVYLPKSEYNLNLTRSKQNLNPKISPYYCFENQPKKSQHITDDTPYCGHWIAGSACDLSCLGSSCGSGAQKDAACARCNVSQVDGKAISNDLAMELAWSMSRHHRRL